MAKYFRGSKKAREEARRLWVQKVAERIHARDAAPYELETFGKHVWDVAWDEACDWALTYHPEVKRLHEEILELYEKLDSFERISSD